MNVTICQILKEGHRISALTYSFSIDGGGESILYKEMWHTFKWEASMSEWQLSFFHCENISLKISGHLVPHFKNIFLNTEGKQSAEIWGKIWGNSNNSEVKSVNAQITVHLLQAN